MTFGSLFSGIGGIDLGLERAGMECKWQVEIDPYCQKVLAKHWPNVKRYGDITRVDGRELERVDLIAGGFPCQDISYAGAGAGIEGERSGLWREMLRVIRMVRPRLVVVENVSALLARGMGRVLGELAESGYDAEWQCLPAAAFGAPHIRDRVFIVAYCQAFGCGSRRTWGSDSSGTRKPEQPLQDVADSECPERWPHTASCNGLARQYGVSQREESSGRPGSSCEDVADAYAERWDGGSWLFGERWRGEFKDGSWWAVEPDVGRVAHGIPNRVDRLRGLGNAVVPQIAEWIGRRILESAP